MGTSYLNNSDAREVTCPSDKLTHNVVVRSLPLCFAIIQHLPNNKRSKEFSGALITRMQTAESEKINDDQIRNEFKSVYKRASEEYKRSRLWDEAVRQVCSFTLIF